MRDRVRELDPAASDPRVIAPAHLDSRVAAHLLARLVHAGVAGEHQSGHYQCLRTRAAFR